MSVEFTGEPLLARCVDAAVVNLCEINTVPVARSGEAGSGGAEGAAAAWYVRAGGGYEEPWTRDASINSWAAASWLIPEVAEATLRKVCEERYGGAVIAQDNQWWDQVIWVVAANRHAQLTGDREFLVWAEGVARRSLAIADAERFVPRYGLFRGGAVMADGISGYPDDVVEPGNESSFVLDHPRAHEILALSANLVHAAAYAALGEMAETLGATGSAEHERADRLMEAIDTHFRHSEGYGYLLVPGRDGEPDRLDDSQEVLGLAMLLLSGHLGPDEAHRLIAGTHREPYGVVPVWPAFQRFAPARPGRHNVIVWPWITALWVAGIGHAGTCAEFGEELSRLTELTAVADFSYPEVQNAQTGAPDGGWQVDQHWTGEYVAGVGRHWRSEPDQTWSATCLLGVVIGSLLGLEPTRHGLRIAPALPPGHDHVRLRGLRYGSALLDIEVTGQGRRLVSLTIDGEEHDPALGMLPTALREPPVSCAARGATATSGAPRAVVVKAVVAD